MNSPVTVTHPSAEMTTPVASTHGPIRVMLIDDERLARQGLRDLLQEFSDVEIVGEADTAASAVAQIPALSPDVIFLDIRLPAGMASVSSSPSSGCHSWFLSRRTRTTPPRPSTWRLSIIYSSPCAAPGWRKPCAASARKSAPATTALRAFRPHLPAHAERTIIAPLSNLISLKARGTSPRRCGGALPAPHLPDARHLRAHAPLAALSPRRPLAHSQPQPAEFRRD